MRYANLRNGIVQVSWRLVSDPEDGLMRHSFAIESRRGVAVSERLSREPRRRVRLPSSNAWQ